MLIRVKPYATAAAGEFVDKDTGEIFKWGDGFQCWAFLPDYEFPVQLKFKSHQHMALNRDCTFDMRVVVKKGVARVKFDFICDGWKDVKSNV